MQKHQILPYIKHASSVGEIIAPVHSMGVSGIFYARIYPDGTIINLANNADWSAFYFKQLAIGQYQHQNIIDQLFNYSGVSLWALNEENPIWQDAKQYFGYSSGVSICEEHAKFREVVGFYSEQDEKKMNHFYINQIDTLKRMKRFFILQAEELINSAEKERQTLNQQVYPKLESLSESINLNNTSSQTEQTISVLHCNTGALIALPSQRGNCLVNLLQGKSIKEIATSMQLSPKTIEHYLAILRKELGCRSSKELILNYLQQVHQSEWKHCAA